MNLFERFNEEDDFSQFRKDCRKVCDKVYLEWVKDGRFEHYIEKGVVYSVHMVGNIPETINRRVVTRTAPISKT